MSPSDSPTGPKLFQRLKKSISGQNLAKANKDSQHGTPEVDVQDTVEEEVQEKGKDGDTGEKEVGDAPAEVESTDAHVEQTPEAVAEDVSGPEQTSDVVDPHTSEHEANSTGEEVKKQKVTGLKRLKSLAKFSIGGHGAAQHTEPAQASTDATDAITEVEAETHAAEADSVTTGDIVGPGDVEVAPAENAETVETAPEAPREENDGDDSSSELAGGDSKYNDPASLADIIRNLVTSLPQPGEPIPVPSKPTLPQLDATGRPIPPPDAVFTDDKVLIAKMRNAAVMNGKVAGSPEGEEQPTVFAVLDSFKAPSTDDSGKDNSDSNDSGGDEQVSDDEGSDVEDEEPPRIITDDSSVMVYIPLVPTKVCKVEMAQSQIVPVKPSQGVIKAFEGKFVEMLDTYRVYGTFGRGMAPPVFAEEDGDGGQVTEAAIHLPRFSWKFWPWKKKTATPAPAPQPPATPAPDTKAPASGTDDKKPEGDQDKKPEDGTDKTPADAKKPAGGDDKTKKPHKLRKPKPVLEQRVWIPSNTHISVHALWWGYRIFLPPPVMSILSDKSVEAVKQAALITTALTWLFAHLPLTMFPAPMQPAILMLQHLVPFLGYIGTFIAWSWATIKSYDVGYGVILSATWILPVALIPGTWHAYDFPGSPTAPGTGAGTPKPSTGTPTGTQPSTRTPSTDTPATQPSTGAPTQPSAGTPTQPSAGTPPAPPSTGTPVTQPTGTPATQPSTGTTPSPATPSHPTTPPANTDPSPTTPGAPLESPITIGAPTPTMSQRLRIVKGGGSGDQENKPAQDANASTGYVEGVWKYLTGSS